MDYVILIMTLSTLLNIYTIYILVNEKKQMKIYNKNIHYITEWDKYDSILKLQKKEIKKLKRKLKYYKIKEKLKWK